MSWSGAPGWTEAGGVLQWQREQLGTCLLLTCAAQEGPSGARGNSRPYRGLENVGVKQTGRWELAVLPSLWDTGGSGRTPCGHRGSRGVSQHYQESRGVIQQAAEAAGEAPLHAGLLLSVEVLGAGRGAASGQQRLLSGKGWKTKGKGKLSKLCCAP